MILDVYADSDLIKWQERWAYCILEEAESLPNLETDMGRADLYNDNNWIIYLVQSR